jgi:hypothetical protein
MLKQYLVLRYTHTHTKYCSNTFLITRVKNEHSLIILKIPSSSHIEHAVCIMKTNRLTLSNPIFLPTAQSPVLIYLHPSSLLFSYKHNRANATHSHLFRSKHMACQETERVQPALSVGQSPYYTRKSVGQAPRAERAQQNMSDVFRHRSGKGKS